MSELKKYWYTAKVRANSWSMLDPPRSLGGVGRSEIFEYAGHNRRLAYSYSRVSRYSLVSDVV